MAKKRLLSGNKVYLCIAMFLIALIITPAFAHKIVDSDGTQTSLEKAIFISDPEISQIFYEILPMSQRHFYTFDAAKGESIHFELLIPLLSGLENYHPTIAFYKIGSAERELIKFTPPMFFGEIPAQRLTFNFGQANWFKNQDETKIIPETGTYAIEIFDEGNCIVIGEGNFEKNCLPEFFSVTQGKYGFVIGTIDEHTFIDNFDGWTKTRVFFEDSIGKLISTFTGGTIESGDSPEDIARDNFRWVIILILIITTIVIISKRKYLSEKIK